MKTINRVLIAALFISVVSAAATREQEVDDLHSSSTLKDLLMAVSMVGVSEIGDKTFLIAALMAMRHPRLLVFSAASTSLALMTVLAGIIGGTFTSLVPQRYTQFAAGILFFIFGYKLALESLETPKDAGVEGELAEVEEEIAIHDMNTNLNETESGGVIKDKRTLVNNRYLNDMLLKVGDRLALYFSPVWIQTFVMVFLGEFGDRSQISTIAMASSSQYWIVILGATIGHLICTAVAVIGGKLLAKRISMRTVNLGGAISFIIFGIVYTYESFHNPN
ncbi:AEL257Wp [Eremothecium gossypii ATCC 10895]|uniref:GDT1 family protein n=1 Tax=Eremothecium gossypii (strain ATCC 10895 / CBS 109.51 / FGSC 9923 / NRRL Y-1056) TaxID=284811 RepID=Q758L8_EREGS|nr:AEL257Wp [Eremothecium gossypii ATCC 10895]AAS52428.1 AEL257Wp [Eremothecium gossypii ATCC 10895]AEY96726.1 FAEL257Wp [Eremothecium gossypii FDAG1]